MRAIVDSDLNVFSAPLSIDTLSLQHHVFPKVAIIITNIPLLLLLMNAVEGDVCLISFRLYFRTETCLYFLFKFFFFFLGASWIRSCSSSSSSFLQVGFLGNGVRFRSTRKSRQSSSPRASFSSGKALAVLELIMKLFFSFFL